MTDNPKQIIHVIPSISEEASGPTYSVTRLCESLIQSGASIQLAALDWASLASPPPYLKVFPLGFGPRRLGISPSFHRWLREQAQTGAADIIHNHGMWQLNSVYPGWVCKKSKAKLVVSPRGSLSTWALAHGSRMKKVFWPLLQRPALEAAACFHATAESEYEEIRQLGFKQPVTIIPNGIDLPEPHQKSEMPQRTLLFLGRIHPKKGLDHLLQAWALLHKEFPQWQLKIVGSDQGYYGSSGYLKELQAFAIRQGLARIEFAGELRGEEKLKAYQEAELFVLPTFSENFGLAVAEALAAGTPAIVSKGAPWQGLEANQCGWWVDIGLEALLEGLRLAMSQPTADLAHQGCLGRDWMVREFSWPAIGMKMAQTYQWLREGGTAPDWVRIN